MTTPELIRLVKDAGFRPIERDTLYNIINDFGDKDFTETVDIPVLS
jgi:aminodeoxyfutalosine synthase